MALKEMAQSTREKKGKIYRAVKEGKGGQDWDAALTWEDNGITPKCCWVSSPSRSIVFLLLARTVLHVELTCLALLLWIPSSFSSWNFFVESLGSVVLTG